MTAEQDALVRAKQLINENKRQTQELYQPEASVLQFPVTQGGPTTIDLGLSTSYSRGRFDVRATRTRKRPRSSSPPQSPSRGVVNGDSLNDDDSRPNPGNASDKQRDGEPKPSVVSAVSANGTVEDMKRTNVGMATDTASPRKSPSKALIPSSENRSQMSLAVAQKSIGALLAKDRPQWHPPWKMYRTIASHHGWVRAVAVDASNEWFATGSADRTIRIFDLATGKLQLTLTGHIATVRSIAISGRHPYMFSVGEDKTVKCWDLEQNKVIRNYHGHLSGVYCCAIHPTLDVLVTGGRDSTIRVWDMRTRQQVFVWGSHRDTVNSVLVQADEPQVVSASADSTVRLWDLAGGKCRTTLTNHKKGIRSLCRHPRMYGFASAAADHIKTWGFPEGRFMRNLSGSEGLVNSLVANEDGVLVSGGDGGEMRFWDWNSGHCFQTERTIAQPGSLECEAGIFAMAFDKSGSRLICGEADKSIKMWKEDDQATEETHPLKWEPDLRPRRY